MKLNENTMKLIVGISSVILMFLISIAIIFIPELQENKLMIHLLAVVESVLMLVVGYYFGSSKSSTDKNKLLNRKDDKALDGNKNGG